MYGTGERVRMGVGRLKAEKNETEMLSKYVLTCFDRQPTKTIQPTITLGLFNKLCCTLLVIG